MSFKEYLMETAKVGTRVLTGKFRNRPGVIESIKKDEKGNSIVVIKLDKGGTKTMKLHPFRIVDK